MKLGRGGLSEDVSRVGQKVKRIIILCARFSLRPQRIDSYAGNSAAGVWATRIPPVERLFARISQRKAG